MPITIRIRLKKLKRKWGKFPLDALKKLFVLIFSFSLRAFAESIQRPFGVRYNPYTQSVEVLSNAQKITAVVSELKGDLSIVCSALRKISATDENLDVESIANMLQNSLNVKGDRSPQNAISPDNSDNSQHSIIVHTPDEMHDE